VVIRYSLSFRGSEERQSLDLNPVIVYPSGLVAVDARVALRAE